MSEGFFSSRWVSRPEQVTECEERAALPAGFRAAGVAAGIKPSGRPDVALLVCEEPHASSAARFTRSGTRSAPVLVSQSHCRLDGLRAVVINAGNANGATGERGVQDALAMQTRAAETVGVAAAEVAVCSTGLLGVRLPMDRVRAGIAAAGRTLRPDGGEELSGAIRTTDRFAKHVALDVRLPSGTVRLSAQAKGAGMMSPSLATMLCFVQTDARLSPATADLLLGVTCKRSFDRITVDGQTSPNDTVILMASGASGVRIEPESPDERALGAALDALLRRLALLVVADGEGAKRIARVHVRGGDLVACERAARAVADSPLVKTALHGGDPNWGRISQAVGAALPDRAPLALGVAIEGVPVCAAGAAVAFDERALAAAVDRDEVSYEITLPGEGAETEVFFSDLSHDYVAINAEYTT